MENKKKLQINEAEMLEHLIGGEKTILIKERQGQEDVVKYERLAKKMSPSQEEWEKLGFTFTDVGDSLLYQATLPSGWKLEATDHNLWTNIELNQLRD